MSAVSDIDWGTISLTNGSTAVTGVGTTWGLDNLRNGDTIVLIVGGENFAPPIIDTANSDTNLTLVTPWAGPSLSNVQYRIRYQWNSSRISAMMRRLVDLLGNGKLQSFAGLDGGADQLPYFDGLNTLAQTPLTPFARTILGDTTQAAVIATLGLLPVQSSAMDTTADRLLRSGAFGLGPGFIDVPNMTAAETQMTRFFRVTASTPGGPGFQAAVVAAVFNATTTCFLAIGVDGRLSVGVKTSDTGTPVWTPLEGTSGNNTNGEWVRFPNGTQICYNTSVALTRTSGTTVQGSWTFPVQFVNSNVQIDFLENALPSANARESAPWATSTATSGTLRLVQNGTWPDPTNITVQAKAIGRWK